jgi:hypothetical protein
LKAPQYFHDTDADISNKMWIFDNV